MSGPFYQANCAVSPIFRMFHFYKVGMAMNKYIRYWTRYLPQEKRNQTGREHTVL